MRSDMAKLIVERPRVGRGLPFPRGSVRGYCRVAIEDLPRHQSIRRIWSGQEKSLNENLAPLRRFLLSNVGRPWNKVFSEICEHMNVKSAVQLHIWQHVKRDLVCLNPVLENGRWQRFDGYGLYQPFFVDPRNGLLRKNEDGSYWCGYRSRRRDAKPPQNLLAIEAGRCYRRIEGIWYEFELAPLPNESSGLFDMVLKRRLKDVARNELIRLHNGPFYAVSKRQLNSKQLKRLPMPE
jgi:hypothetical protein